MNFLVKDKNWNSTRTYTHTMPAKKVRFVKYMYTFVWHNTHHVPYYKQKAGRILVKLLSEAGTGFFYTTSKNPRKTQHKIALRKVRILSLNNRFDQYFSHTHKSIHKKNSMIPSWGNTSCFPRPRSRAARKRGRIVRYPSLIILL